WSSDVCSSDLNKNRWRPAGTGPGSSRTRDRRSDLSGRDRAGCTETSAPGRWRYPRISLLCSWSSVLERDVGADRVHSLERIVEPIWGRFRVPAAQHLVRLPQVESTEVDSCAGHSRPPRECIRE